MKKVLTIAGFDSSGGAGLQADIKTFLTLGVHDLSVVSAVTAQNSKGVYGKKRVDFLKEQLETLGDDIKIDAIKIGMLSNKKDIKIVKNFLKNRKIPIVLDTPWVSSSGYDLLDKRDIQYFAKKLFKLSTLITPNTLETNMLVGFDIKSLKEMKKAAKKLHKKYKLKHILIKGGHIKGDVAIDLLYDGKNFYTHKEKRVKSSVDFHGTGCVYSSAIAAYLAKGYSVKKAVKKAKKYITKSIKKSYRISKNGSKYLKGK